MSSGFQSNDFSAFCEFVLRMQEQGVQDITPEQSVEHFREEQEKLRRWNERNAISVEQARRGEAKPLDFEAVWTRAKERIAQDGIID